MIFLPRTLPVVIILVATYLSCSDNRGVRPLSAADSLSIIEDNTRHREETGAYFRDDPDSPFRKDTTIEFHGLNWFAINPYYRAHSVIHRYENPETVIVMGTRGEERKQLRYGYFEFSVPDEQGRATRLRLNVYKFTPHDTKRYALYRDNLSVWFTDKTTGKETYNVGRYVEVGDEQPDPDHVYTIDLNKAYNPYCAYSDLFSCAVPRKEDHLDIALRVGEMKYHDNDNHSHAGG